MEDSVIVDASPIEGENEPLAPKAAPAAVADVAAPSPAPNSAYGTIAFWIVMSCSVILFNKILYVTVFPYPLTLTSIHMGFASVCTWSLRASGKLEGPSFDLSFWIKSVLPIGVLYATSLATSNLGASMLSVSFVQMIKALTPLVTLGASIVFKVEQGSPKQFLIVAVICSGVIIASAGEMLWNGVGVMFQCTSVLAEGCRLVITQILLQKHLPKANPLVSISIFAPPSFVLLFPVALWFEPRALASLAVPTVGLAVLFNTLTAFVLNLSVVMLVSRTSGLILTLAGIVKDIVMIVASMYIFANPVTVIQVFGYLLALIGLNMYNVYKTNKDPNQTAFDIAKESVKNTQALLIYGSIIMLLILSTLAPQIVR
jgi:drug/metabolite transporter (DMT)-like permease